MGRRLQDSNAVILYQQSSAPIITRLFSIHPSMGQACSTHLQHMQQSRLSRVVEPEEEELGVFVEQAQRGEDVVDWCAVSASIDMAKGRGDGMAMGWDGHGESDADG